VTREHLVAAIHDAQNKVKAPIPGVNITYNPMPVLGVFRSIYADAYLSGIKAAGDSSDGIVNINALANMATNINWDDWKPGDPEAALTMADGGLKDLLDAADQTVKDVTDTTLLRMGNAIADGLASGASVDTIASALQDFLDDPSRADMIATTEVNRAQTTAQAEQLDAMGFSQWTWLAYDGACDECADNDGQDFSFDDDMPPAHPWCRCSIVGSGEAALSDDNEED